VKCECFCVMNFSVCLQTFQMALNYNLVSQWTVDECILWLDSIEMASAKDSFRGM